jgi:PAS domain S-box-containing protein
MKERIPQKMENEFIYPDGSRAWFELGMQPVPEGVFILSIDISDRKKAEEALHESEERFSKAFRFSPVGINIFRLSDGRSVDVNDAFLRLIGYEREEVIGHTVAEFNLRVDPGVRDAWIKSLKQGNNIQDIDLHIGRKDGQIAQVLFSLSPIEIMDEAMGLVLAVDITERTRE